MDCEMHIPFTFRTVRRAPKTAATMTFAKLKELIHEALKPFDEARQALVQALLNYSEVDELSA